MSKDKVKLTINEIRAGAFEGVQRRCNHLLTSPDKKGTPWDIDIEGAIKEKAVAKFLQLYWQEDADLENALDVGNKLEVRGTPYFNGCLIIYEKDKDNIPYILITGSAPEFHFKGWLFGKDAKQKEWWKTKADGKKKPAYFVPQYALRPNKELFNHLKYKEN